MSELKKEKKLNESDGQKQDFLISVIVPVFNMEKYLKRCLDSLLTQTYKKLEIICVDDGSTDHSMEILDFYKHKDKRIKVFTQHNRGPSAARNMALNHASGQYISFVDSDDFLQWNAYEILAEVASQKESWDIIIFGANLVGQEIGWLSDKLTTNFKVYKNCKPGDVIFQEKAAKPFLWQHFLKRELLEIPTRIRFDECMKLGEDQLLQFLYVPRAENVITIDDKLYNYRISRNTSLMQYYNHRRIQKTECHFEIVQKVINEWQEFGYYENYKDELWTWIVNFLYYTLCDFPVCLKKKYTEQFFKLMKQNEIEFYLIAEKEQSYLVEMEEWRLCDGDEKEELMYIRGKIVKEKIEISETIKSRAFRVGRLLTPASNRIDIDAIKEGLGLWNIEKKISEL